MIHLEELRQEAAGILRKANYNVFENISSNTEMCFEILAQHKTMELPTLIIKIIENIDTIRPHFIYELKLLAHLLKAVPLLIGVENRRDPLADDSIYIRKELCAINIKTFRKVITSTKIPLYFAKKGGFFISIDGKKLARLREKYGYSRKDLAEMLHVTPKSIAQYETKAMRPSRQHAEMMEKIFGECIIIPLDFLKQLSENPPRMELNDKLRRRITAKTREFIELINEIVEETGYKSFWLRTSVPFDIFIYKVGEEEHIITEYGFIGGTQIKGQKDERRFEIQEYLLEQMPKEQESGIIVDKEIVNEKRIKKVRVPYILPEELRLLEEPKQFRKLIEKRDRRVKSKTIRI